MPIEGHMINGKFMGTDGRVYKPTPKDAVILDTLSGNGSNGNESTTGSNPATPTEQPQQPAQKEHLDVGSTTPPAPPATPPIPQKDAAPQPVTYPKCISYQILKAVQTTSFVQVSVRAHCKDQFADSVIHYDFDTIEELYRAGDLKEEIGTFLGFKKDAIKLAHAEAIQVAKQILCEQYKQE